MHFRVSISDSVYFCSMSHYMQYVQSVCLATFGLRVAAYVLTISGINVPLARAVLV